MLLGRYRFDVWLFYRVSTSGQATNMVTALGYRCLSDRLSSMAMRYAGLISCRDVPSCMGCTLK